ncbi:MAG TPA: GerMN domain-containing protein [Smithellaceae bacterium]|jgi:hypothetical protein|nr:GerMN domain-containing protein [Deltaproteobacteria bacterium]HOD30331.1 GerMN domain-containing protein [Smithellaceae bacterium]HQM43513.1 GerMN domain-containing protein [Smithellaceae bacterium]HQO14527.1 GerMN domain-containing protein [Smithellaceae bacterium]
MTTKRQRRVAAAKNRKKKKSTRILYLLAILGSIFIVLVIFFLILFNALFPAVDKDSLRKKEKYAVTIYFSDRQERFLLPEKRYVIKEDNPARQTEEIVKALLNGSKAGLIDTFPDGVEVKDVNVDRGGTASVNFNSNLKKLHPGGSAAEMITIYSLVNSITQNVDEVKRVKILVEGKETSSIKGHISTKNYFQPNKELIVKAQEGKS